MMRLLAPILVCLPLLAHGQQPAHLPAQQADALRQRAETLYGKGEYVAARRYYEQAYQRIKRTDPDLAEDVEKTKRAHNMMQEAFLAQRAVETLQRLRAQDNAVSVYPPVAALANRSGRCIGGQFGGRLFFVCPR